MNQHRDHDELWWTTDVSWWFGIMYQTCANSTIISIKSVTKNINQNIVIKNQLCHLLSRCFRRVFSGLRAVHAAAALRLEAAGGGGHRHLWGLGAEAKAQGGSTKALNDVFVELFGGRNFLVGHFFEMIYIYLFDVSNWFTCVLFFWNTFWLFDVGCFNCSGKTNFYPSWFLVTKPAKLQEKLEQHQFPKKRNWQVATKSKKDSTSIHKTSLFSPRLFRCFSTGLRLDGLGPGTPWTETQWGGHIGQGHFLSKVVHVCIFS